jgi:hypothetical protein
MRVSRATFLKAFGTALFGARVDARALLQSAAQGPTLPEPPRAAGPVQLADADAALFRPHLNTSFSVRSGDLAPARFVLAKVPERAVTRNVEQFSLIFHSAPDTALPQGTHSFHHPSLGAFDLFIVPIGAPNGRRTAYQACFSRHQRPDETARGQAPAPTRRRT